MKAELFLLAGAGLLLSCGSAIADQQKQSEQLPLCPATLEVFVPKEHLDDLFQFANQDGNFATRKVVEHDGLGRFTFHITSTESKVPNRGSHVSMVLSKTRQFGGQAQELYEKQDETKCRFLASRKAALQFDPKVSLFEISNEYVEKLKSDLMKTDIRYTLYKGGKNHTIVKFDLPDGSGGYRFQATRYRAGRGDYGTVGVGALQTLTKNMLNVTTIIR
jgi:hypothetical protein